MEIELKQQELLDLGEGPHGGTILCLSGSCWVTQTGDSRDHILRTGQHFSIRKRGQLIVTATESCRLMLVAESATVKSGSLWQQLPCGN